jgi:hypothetical protein
LLFVPSPDGTLGMSELLVRKIEISNKTHIEEAKCDEGIRYQLPELYGQMTER